MKLAHEIELKNIKFRLIEARDSLHDAKLVGDAEDVAQLEQLIRELNDRKREILDATTK